jgi:uncharacterized protein (TIGR02246 family)
MPITEAGRPELILAHFSRAVDQRCPEAVADLFAEHCLFRPGDKEFRGRAAILAHYLRRLAEPGRVTRHIWSNVDCRIMADGEARIDALLNTHAYEPAVSETELQMRLGDVQARCVLEDGAWRFAEHLYTRVFATSLPMAGGRPLQADAAEA